MSVIEEIRALPKEMLTLLEQQGFSASLFESLAASVGTDPDVRNRVSGVVSPPMPNDVLDLPSPTGAEAERLAHRGLDVLAKGQLAFVVMSGGMATSMGGVVKALVEVVDGLNFLDLRLNENRTWSQRVGHNIPLWMMTSLATDASLREALRTRTSADHIATFQQNVSLRLSADGSLFRSPDGVPSLYAPGHGDLPDALRRAGLLQRFIERGGKYVWIANIDNLGAGIDPVILGWHAEHGAPVTVEVVNKVDNDRGGIPARWNDKPVILEEFRLPRDFDPTRVGVFNTNTFVVDAAKLNALDFAFTWFQVKKKVDAIEAIQFERLIGEITTALDTRFVRVPREGTASRFIPVKDHDELANRREQIRMVAASRGMLS